MKWINDYQEQDKKIMTLEQEFRILRAHVDTLNSALLAMGQDLKNSQLPSTSLDARVSALELKFTEFMNVVTKQNLKGEKVIKKEWKNFFNIK